MSPDLVADHSENGRLWLRLASYARKAGRGVAHHALSLYYASLSPDTPAWAKAIIGGALAYFLLPIDAIPDLLPLVGFTDDLSALATAAFTVAAHVTPEHHARADETLANWLGK